MQISFGLKARQTPTIIQTRNIRRLYFHHRNYAWFVFLWFCACKLYCSLKLENWSFNPPALFIFLSVLPLFSEVLTVYEVKNDGASSWPAVCHKAVMYHKYHHTNKHSKHNCPNMVKLTTQVDAWICSMHLFWIGWKIFLAPTFTIRDDTKQAILW